MNSDREFRTEQEEFWVGEFGLNTLIAIRAIIVLH